MIVLNISSEFETPKGMQQTKKKKNQLVDNIISLPRKKDEKSIKILSRAVCHCLLIMRITRNNVYVFQFS